MKFKSNINCSSCETRVKKVLDSEPTIHNWKVDLEHSDRILTIESSLAPQEVAKIVLRAGFKAYPIS